MIMKILNKSLIAMGICLSFSAHAADDRYIIQVDSANKGVVKNLAKKLGADINVEGEEFFAATFTGKDLETVKGLLNNPHIQLIEEDAKRKLLSYSDDIGDARETQLTPYAVYQSQADQLTLQPNDFIKVCVIDSGLDRSNNDFEWTNITGDNDSGTGNWDENGGPHGTHVAGTIGAADNGFGIIGMAPGVPMHIVKVFNSDGWGYSSDLAYAAEKCADAGSNIINMSLGGGAPTTAEENAFKAFTNDGGLVLAAAGNSGNDVLSFPAGYQSVMMVGANDNNDQIAAFSQFPECTIVYNGKKGKNSQEIIDSTCVEVTAGGVNTLSTYPANMASTSVLAAGEQIIASSSFTFSGQGDVSGEVHYMGLGNAVDTNANGKICLMDRGEITFDEKVLNCENSGGIGAVVVNNVDGMLNGTLGEATTTSIPAVGTDLKDRALLHASSTIGVEVSTSDYGFMSGTSMATPGVAGMAALLWSNHQECTGTQIRDALKQTAFDAGASGRDNYFGYGIVKVADANEYLLANGCDQQAAAYIELATSTYTAKQGQKVNLEWSNATARKVDVYRNGVIVSTTGNDGSFTDTLASDAFGMYTYKVCDQSSGNCSNPSSVSFE
ncbi:alkaline serine protease [Vibrio natriegens]|nr:alkaline serine protease [Vibrio natriegens]